MIDSAPGESWLVDEPIGTPAEDLLGRAPFAGRVSEVLDDAGRLASSTVLGLAGPWGSGKTSTIKLVLSHLGEPWRVREVNPWGLRGAEEIVIEVLTSISSAFPEHRARKLRKSISTYARLASPLLSAVPVAGNAASSFATAVSMFLSSDHTVAEHAADVRAMLAAMKRPVLIVIDDIDRLQPLELLALFKTVRLLGRLPYVHYLLAYDDRTVRELIMATPIATNDPDRAAEFMEKVVSVRLDQPPTRPEQADALYEAQMRTLLTTCSVELTQRQQFRVRDEHRGLLRAILREPRTIGRFFAQLYTYLPLVGTADIDLPDYIALTLLRTSFPRVYEALSRDRKTLVGESLESYDNPLGRWRHLDDTLDQLQVPNRHQPLLTESLELLFPRLSAMYRQSQADDAERKRDGRASDGDYIDRYFALLLPTNEVSDTTITGALTEWISGRPEDNAEKIRAAIIPSKDRATMYAKSAAVLRRCRAKSLTFQQDDMPPLAAAVTRLLVDIPEQSIDPATEWLATVLQRCVPMPAPNLIELVDAPVNKQSALWPLMTAVNRAMISLRKSDERIEWLSDLARALSQIALQRYLGQVTLGDTAPHEAAFGYLLYATDKLGSDKVNERLVAALKSGDIDVCQLAARFVNVGTYMNDYRRFVVEFDLDELVRRVSWNLLSSRRAELRSSADEFAEDTWDRFDTSWANLRRYACAELTKRLQPEHSVLPTLPSVPDAVLNQVRNQSSPGFVAPQPADLQFAATVFAPSGLVHHGALDDHDFDQSSKRWQAQLANQPITHWLTENNETWHGSLVDWRSTDSDGRTYQQSQLELRQSPGNNPADDSIAIVAAASQVRFAELTTNVGTRLSKVLTVELAFWLAELDSNRHVSHPSRAARPLPSALTLTELWPALHSLVATALQPSLLPDTLDQSPDHDLVLHLIGTSSSGLDAGLDLRTLRREISRQTGRATTTVSTPRSSRYETQAGKSVADPNSIVASLLRDWLRDNGYRDFEPELRAASRRFQ